VDPNTSIALGRQVLVVALNIAAPLLGIGLLVGVALALFQAVTSLQEQTLTMVPKILSMGAALFFLLPYLLTELTDFARVIFYSLAHYGGSV
jgi:flagellar biosynthetic protein FliQ